MKLLIEIDQIRSLREGHDAPHSTRVIDIDPQKIPDEILQLLIENWDPVKKRAVIGDKPVKIILPLTEEKVIQKMEALYDEWIGGREKGSGSGG